MGRKVFVSYKHNDHNVNPLKMFAFSTARDYVDQLIDLFEEDGEIYRGEGDEDLSEFKDETIKTRLKKKIHDSSVTLVLVSQGMEEAFTKEADQWIPWEVSYSLKEIVRNDKTSHPNAVICIVLPDRWGQYNYYMNYYDIGEHEDVCELNTPFLFEILARNMFNRTHPKHCKKNNCPCQGSVYFGDSCYILSVTWEDFINDKDSYLDEAIRIRDNRKQYDITVEIPDDA